MSRAHATGWLRIPRGDWSALSTALLRGDNIEEGHYVERLWAALLSPPVDATYLKLVCLATRALRGQPRQP